MADLVSLSSRVSYGGGTGGKTEQDDDGNCLTNRCLASGCRPGECPNDVADKTSSCFSRGAAAELPSPSMRTTREPSTIAIPTRRIRGTGSKCRIRCPGRFPTVGLFHGQQYDLPKQTCLSVFGHHQHIRIPAARMRSTPTSISRSTTPTCAITWLWCSTMTDQGGNVPCQARVCEKTAKSAGKQRHRAARMAASSAGVIDVLRTIRGVMSMLGFTFLCVGIGAFTRKDAAVHRRTAYPQPSGRWRPWEQERTREGCGPSFRDSGLPCPFFHP